MPRVWGHTETVGKRKSDLEKPLTVSFSDSKRIRHSKRHENPRWNASAARWIILPPVGLLWCVFIFLFTKIVFQNLKSWRTENNSDSENNTNRPLNHAFQLENDREAKEPNSLHAVCPKPEIGCKSALLISDLMRSKEWNAWVSGLKAWSKCIVHTAAGTSLQDRV